MKISCEKLEKEAQTEIDLFGFAFAFLRQSLIIVDEEKKKNLSPQREQR